MSSVKYMLYGFLFLGASSLKKCSAQWWCDFLLRTCLNSPHMWIIPTSHPIGFPQPNFKFCGTILAEEQVQGCKYKLCSQNTKNIVQSGLLTSTAICCKLWMLKFSDPGKCAFWHFEIILHCASCSKQAFFALRSTAHEQKLLLLQELLTLLKSWPKQSGNIVVSRMGSSPKAHFLGYQQVPARNRQISSVQLWNAPFSYEVSIIDNRYLSDTSPIPIHFLGCLLLEPEPVTFCSP